MFLIAETKKQKGSKIFVHVCILLHGHSFSVYVPQCDLHCSITCVRLREPCSSTFRCLFFLSTRSEPFKMGRRHLLCSCRRKLMWYFFLEPKLTAISFSSRFLIIQKLCNSEARIFFIVKI